MVRFGKLLGGMLSELSRKRQELASLYLRLSAECAINLMYLIKKDSDDVYESYVRYSLRHEKSLLERIQSSVDERDGSELPIERRMRESILESFMSAGVNREDVDSSERTNWGGDSIYGRCNAVGLQSLYLAIFSGGSHFIHGNWQDLFDSHLVQRDDGLFLPNTDWGRPRPQLINLSSRLAVEAMRSYLGHLDAELRVDAEPTLQDLFDRVHFADYLHEEYIIARRAA